MKNQSSSNRTVVYAVFTAFLPLTFHFSDGKTMFLLDSPFGPLWCFLALGISVFLLIHFRDAISVGKLTALAVLYLVIPFTFYWSAGEFSFLVLGSNVLLVATMAITGAGLLVKCLTAKQSAKGQQGSPPHTPYP